jgi:hypothetical protein
MFLNDMNEARQDGCDIINDENNDHNKNNNNNDTCLGITLFTCTG